VSKYNNSRYIINLPILISIAIAGGMLIGATMFGKDGHGDKYNDILKSVGKYRDILTAIDQNYVDKVNTDELVDFSITQMLEKLDPHSVYIPVKDVAKANEELQGNYEGIGIEFNIIKDTIYVVAPLSGGPSESVGIQPGDKILKVNGETVAGVNINIKGVHDRLKGPKGSKVKVSVLRKDERNPVNFTITRDKIPQYSLEASYMVDKQTGYMKITRFAATTFNEFKTALTDLKKQGMTQLILDLRGNPGGYFDRANKICDEFLPDNKLIVYTKSKGSRFDERVVASSKGEFEDGALIVLIDEGSASASEIVAGAIQDNDRGLIVGRRSYGKGLVQIPFNISDGSELRLTISRYYTPSGRSIQKPYNAGDFEEYSADISKRAQHGEFFHADSIKFNDSLKYQTTKGRVVYGGGGIMPDVFVPKDTSMITQYLVEMTARDVIREYAHEYYFRNRKTLEKMKFEEFLHGFEITDKMIGDIVKMANDYKIKYRDNDLKISKNYIKTQVKGLIARSVWGNNSISGNNKAYPILNEQDNEFQQAMKLFGKAKSLAHGN
jgi:carboxyl-terminal processing protease